MKSGDPKPNDDLKIVLSAKRSAPSPTIEIVSDASRWLKAALKGADLHYSYSTCEEEHYGHSVFTVVRRHGGAPAVLEIKIAEIGERPFVFAEVRLLGGGERTGFPFFGDLRSDSHRDLLLHYIADFVLSTDS